MTLKDIAREAGVSVSTVSRILNGNDSSAAGKETQDKIWKIARAHGYVPNSSAQALKYGSTNHRQTDRSIACLFARSADAPNDPFFSVLLRSIEQAALKEGFIVKYSFSAFDLQAPATVRQITDSRVDGVAILGRCSKETLTFLKEHFKKVVYSGLNMLDADYDQIVCDGYAVAYDAMNYLSENGHKRIGYIGETKNEIRYQAYRNFLRDHRITPDKSIITNADASSTGGYQGARRILERAEHVTAFFCMNDITAIGAIKAIQEKGYRIPEDISLIGMDDIELAQFVSPMLTTMHIPIEEMGKMTAKILIDRISGGHTLPMKISLPYYLVNRESCGRALHADLQPKQKPVVL